MDLTGRVGRVTAAPSAKRQYRNFKEGKGASVLSEATCVPIRKLLDQAEE